MLTGYCQWTYWVRVQDVQLSISEFFSTLANLELILLNRFPETNETG